MRIALIADIHGQPEPLRAVLADIRLQGIEDIWCLGDIAGSPKTDRECVELVHDNCTMTVQGNHDVVGPDPKLGYAMQEHLADLIANSPAKGWLENLPRKLQCGPIEMTHGSPHDPLWHQAMPDNYFAGDRIAGQGDDEGELDLALWAANMETKIILTGHTHTPFCAAHRDGVWKWFYPQPGQSVSLSKTDRYILNPGAVLDRRWMSLDEADSMWLAQWY